MKILSNNRYKELLEKEQSIVNDKNLLFELSSLITLAHKVFSNNLGNNIENFKDSLNELALVISEVLNYDVILFGYKDESKLIDLKTYYNRKEINNDHLRDLGNVQIEESIVGKIIIETNDVFLYESIKGKSLTNYNYFNELNPKLNISKAQHDNLKNFFSFIEGGLKNLVVCPITPEIIDQNSSVGYLVLANKSNFQRKEEKVKFEVLRNYLYQIFKNQTGLINQNRDSKFISDIFSRHFKYGIKETLKYFVTEFNFYYSSFWVPTKCKLPL